MYYSVVNTKMLARQMLVYQTERSDGFVLGRVTCLHKCEMGIWSEFTQLVGCLWRADEIISSLDNIDWHRKFMSVVEDIAIRQKTAFCEIAHLDEVSAEICFSFWYWSVKIIQ